MSLKSRVISFPLTYVQAWLAKLPPSWARVSTVIDSEKWAPATVIVAEPSRAMAAGARLDTRMPEVTMMCPACSSEKPLPEPSMSA